MRDSLINAGGEPQVPPELWSAGTSAIFSELGIEIKCSAVQLSGPLQISTQAVFGSLQGVVDRRRSADAEYQRQLTILRNAQAHAIQDFSAVVNQIGEAPDVQDESGLLVALPDDLTSQVRNQAELVQRAQSNQLEVYRQTVGLAEGDVRQWLNSSGLLPESSLNPDTVEVAILSEEFIDGVDPGLFLHSIVDLVAEGPDGTVDEQLRDQLDTVLFNFRVPVFGSPPEGFTPFGTLLSKSPYIGGFGSLITGQGVWVTVASVGIGIVLHIAAPGFDNLARKMDSWSSEKLDLPPE